MSANQSDTPRTDSHQWMPGDERRETCEKLERDRARLVTALNFAATVLKSERFENTALAINDILRELGEA